MSLKEVNLPPNLRKIGGNSDTSKHEKLHIYQWDKSWRREWDSNPRGALTPTRFPSVRLKPLGHPSNSAALYPRLGRTQGSRSFKPSLFPSKLPRPGLKGRNEE